MERKDVQENFKWKTSDVFATDEAWEEEYKKIVNEWLDDLSVGICNIVKVLNPSIIVFGGGIGNYIDYYKKGLLDRLKEQLPIDVVADLKIEKAAFNDDSALVGGSYLIFQDN